MRLRNVKNSLEIMNSGRYYINNPSDYKGKWNKLFKNNNPIYIEIGMGKGKFILENALLNPNINYIGIEKYDSVIVRAIQKTNAIDINNLFLVRIDAKDLLNIFDREIDTIYLNFSDPWPKKRHAKKRLTSETFLPIYDGIFKNSKRIIMKTDNIDLFNYSLESLRQYGYDIVYLTNDLTRENISNIMTEYEEKFVALGTRINMLVAVKNG